MFERVYKALSKAGLQDVREYEFDAPSVKVHPDAFGCLKKRQTGTREVARRWSTKMHVLGVKDTHLKSFILSGGKNMTRW